MAEDWSDKEIEVIIADYFSMLKEEWSNEPYSKTEHRNRISPLLNSRAKGSIEFKHQNISAVLDKLGAPWIPGYKPRRNYQKKLEDKVEEYIKRHSDVERIFLEFALYAPNGSDFEIDYSQVEVTPPANEPDPEPKGPDTTKKRAIKINYLEVEQANSKLGLQGEEFVFEYEKWRLRYNGKDNLADKVEWVSQTQGDGLGFDILSKNDNGTDRYVEVKTTKLGKDAPIFFTKGEYEFSAKHAAAFYLYRVFEYKKEPKLFIVNGRFDDFCRFQATQFKGVF